MRSGFTLLELMVVIIILGVLSTLGVMQYQAAIEKSRGAEARIVLGLLRNQCAAMYMANKNSAVCTEENLRIGLDRDMVPKTCRPTHFFSYKVDGAVGSTLAVTATRCVGLTGKQPGADTAHTLSLTTDYVAGTDIWLSTGGY